MDTARPNYERWPFDNGPGPPEQPDDCQWTVGATVRKTFFVDSFDLWRVSGFARGGAGARKNTKARLSAKLSTKNKVRAHITAALTFPAPDTHANNPLTIAKPSPNSSPTAQAPTINGSNDLSLGRPRSHRNSH
jgi:hypothetical protein